MVVVRPPVAHTADGVGRNGGGRSREHARLGRGGRPRRSVRGRSLRSPFPGLPGGGSRAALRGPFLRGPLAARPAAPAALLRGALQRGPLPRLLCCAFSRLLCSPLTGLLHRAVPRLLRGGTLPRLPLGLLGGAVTLRLREQVRHPPLAGRGHLRLDALGGRSPVAGRERIPAGPARGGRRAASATRWGGAADAPFR